MPLRFTNLREPVAVDALSPLERKQLRVAGKLYDGKDLPAERRFSAGLPEDADDEEVESCFGGYLELWDVLDDAGVHRYDAYLYAVDSGSVFRHGTTDVVAEMIQFYFQASKKDPALAEALQAAQRSADKALQQARKAARKAAAKKTAAKKTAPKKNAAKKTAAKKTAAKKTPAKKTAAKKTAAKKTAAKKTASKKTAAKKTAAKKTASKKTAAKKTAAKKTTAKTTAAKKPAAEKRAR